MLCAEPVLRSNAPSALLLRRDCLRCIKGRFVLSYNDHSLVRELYADYKIEELAHTYTICGSGKSG
ncbi:hypothetical protein AGMMS50229_09710 [Campylobacterota bacterium]|nr:hypothetical protein AGMMS50229_09710 [Campylobacterota bacterium]